MTVMAGDSGAGSNAGPILFGACLPYFAASCPRTAPAGKSGV